VTDYVRDIGGNTTLMIRHYQNMDFDFYVKTGVDTYNSSQDWEYAFVGAPVNHRVHNLVRGGGWQLLGSHRGGDMGADFDIRLTIFDEGLGFPTYNFIQHISLIRRPDPPAAPYMIERSTSFIRVSFDWGFDGGPYLGGAPILEAEMWASYDTVPRFLHSNTNDTYFTGLSPKTRYFFWGKYRNAAGWSDLGLRSEFWTSGVPDKPLAPAVSGINALTARGAHRTPDPGNGGFPILEFQTGYGLDPVTPTAFISGKNINLTALNPAKKYYFWARARNIIGWGPWSNRTDVQLPAGGWAKDAGVWKRALPWINVGGVWKIASPNVPINGTWKVPTS